MYNKVMHLADYMARKGVTDQVAADETGFSRPTISRIRRRKVKPTWDTLAVLKDWSGGKITADDFVDEPAE